MVKVDNEILLFASLESLLGQICESGKRSRREPGPEGLSLKLKN